MDSNDHRQTSLVLRVLVPNVSIALVRSDNSGWHFAAWYGTRIEQLPIYPSAADRERRFNDPTSAIAYFRQEYAELLARRQ
jgi:hypothetical protein